MPRAPRQSKDFIELITYKKLKTFFRDSIVLSDCELLVEARKINVKVNRRFDVSDIILKIDVVYANVKVAIRELKIFEYLICVFHSA